MLLEIEIVHLKMAYGSSLSFKNGVWFFPIIVNKEGESWERLKNEAFPKLVDGTFDEAYQKELLEMFEKALA